ncbi:MAG: regulatory protein DeoR [Ilumatobacteraceae bacterium]|nr:regulatory protein DeoR [Ilumatobacteraceae bacterium]
MHPETGHLVTCLCENLIGMRADRLVAILLLLQRREQVTAAEVAEELEVSERTARRDLEALGMAGIPVYPIRGRNGGWRLAGGGRTDLSGLNADEARALFLLAGPQAQLTPEARAALRKLVRALPEPLRERAEAASDAVVLDPTAWGSRASRAPAPPHLAAVQRAVIDREELRLGYQGRGDASERTVHPLGVVAKGQTWYLIADTDNGRRTFRVDRITSLEPTGETAVRPDGFDLAQAWEDVLERVDDIRFHVTAHGTVDPELVGVLEHALGTRATFGEVTRHGVEVEMRGHDIRSFAAEIAGFGRHLHIVDPPELRAALAIVGRELIERYA